MRCAALHDWMLPVQLKALELCYLGCRWHFHWVGRVLLEFTRTFLGKHSSETSCIGWKCVKMIFGGSLFQCSWDHPGVPWMSKGQPWAQEAMLQKQRELWACGAVGYIALALWSQRQLWFVPLDLTSWLSCCQQCGRGSVEKKSFWGSRVHGCCQSARSFCCWGCPASSNSSGCADP